MGYSRVSGGTAFKYATRGRTGARGKRYYPSVKQRSSKAWARMKALAREHKAKEENKSISEPTMGSGYSIKDFRRARAESDYSSQ